MEKELSASVDKLLPFAGAGDTSTHQKLPVYFCTRAAIDQVLVSATGKDLATLEHEIDSNLVPRSAELRGWRAAGQTNVVERKATIKNVVAVLDGEGPHADETIVIGAHYDHLGLGGAGSLAPWTTDIHNGADDNASGTATLLEVARRLASAADEAAAPDCVHRLHRRRAGPLRQRTLRPRAAVSARKDDRHVQPRHGRPADRRQAGRLWHRHGQGIRSARRTTVQRARLQAHQARRRLRAERSFVVLRQEDPRAAPVYRATTAIITAPATTRTS